MSRYFLILFFIFFAAGCTNNHAILKLIKNWEKTQHQISIQKIEPTGKFTDFTMRDSLLILEYMYLNEKTATTTQLQKQNDSLNNQISNTLYDIEKTKNQVMKKILEKGLQSQYRQKEQLIKIVDIYKHHPDKTRLKPLIERIEKYRQYPDSVIGYYIEVSFTGFEGLLPIQEYSKKYLFNREKSKLVGEIK